MLRLYSITVYYPDKTLVYIIKSLDQASARNFLIDHLKNCNCRVGEFVFFQEYFEVTLFDSYDPEIIEILPYELYSIKY